MNRRVWISLFILVLAWFLLKDFAYRAYVAGTVLPEAEQATYQGDDGWLLLPVEDPPGAWTEPWGIDLFVLPPPSATPVGKGLIGTTQDASIEQMTRVSHEIENSLSVAGPAYSAFYRHPSALLRGTTQDWDVAREDVTLAFERYLQKKNNWRGVLIVSAPGTEELLEPLLTRISSDERLVERFSGVLFLSSSPQQESPKVSCSPALDDDCTIQASVTSGPSILSRLLPQLRRAPVRFDFSKQEDLGRTIAARNTNLSHWLDANAPKPAEPLGGLEAAEVIEIAPIRRPGETDEIIAERELRTD